VVSANLIRVTCAAAPGQESVPLQQLAFDGLGRLVEGTAGTETVQRRYDSLGRLIEESARGQVVRMEYDDTNGFG
jgi:YD repeat-containing protein